MGFLDKAKELAQSAGETLEAAAKITKEKAVAAKCATGFHAGDWKNIEGKPLCYFQKTCPDCYKELEKWEHKFEDGEYARDGSCEYIEKCNHCGKLQHSIKHIYKIHRTQNYCVSTKQCSRCGKEITIYSHRYERLTNEQVQCCICGEIKSKDEAIKQMQDSTKEQLETTISFFKSLF
ncbi:hypothetical protein [Helicobacter rodentium]|uniref:hypothetical protein n=1 Tax=Helicobacter rodentium TaxID=59617 RepID=UPI0023556FB1|nr:hypothetical protein [Helicobacter rodentium]